MICKICQNENKEVFIEKILHKYDVSFLKCENCDFISTEEPYWLDEAYNNPINIEDTGVLNRNIISSYFTTNIIYYFFNHKKTFLDYASGYGIFVRLMRDIGINFKWQDNFSKNLLARGFDYSKKDNPIELITAFEVFEHFVNPLEEIEKMLMISKNILFSTTLIPSDIPNPKDWWYYGFNHGQHVSFYSQKTIKFIARKYGLNYYTNGFSVHLLTENKINSLFFKFLISRKSFLLQWFAKLNFKSKTLEDSINVIKNN
jgi:hypothetical protein